MYVRSSMSTVSDGYGCPHYHLHHRRANTLLVTLTLRSSLTGPLAPISNNSLQVGDISDTNLVERLLSSVDLQIGYLMTWTSHGDYSNLVLVVE